MCEQSSEGCFWERETFGDIKGERWNFNDDYLKYISSAVYSDLVTWHALVDKIASSLRYRKLRDWRENANSFLLITDFIQLSSPCWFEATSKWDINLNGKSSNMNENHWLPLLESRRHFVALLAHSDCSWILYIQLCSRKTVSREKNPKLNRLNIRKT